MRLVKRTLFALALLVGFALVASMAIVVGSLPNHAGTLRLAGLDAPVTIRRDAHAVPYIEARSEADGYFALGFVHAQDRLWQMEMRRRIAEGRLAELVGAGGLPVDRFMRLLRLYPIADASLEAMAPDARALIAAYTAGVNAYLTERRRLLPPEFWLLWHRPEAWTDTDSVVFVKLMALDLAGNWQRELLRAELVRDLPRATYDKLFPDAPAPDDVTLAALRHALEDIDLAGLADLAGPPPPMGHGSNAWVVDGRHTASGAPLLANDPHLGLSMPGTWYLAGLKTPDLEVVGATLPGLPVFVLGRTDRIAWGMTNTGSDVQDLVIEAFVGEPAVATRTVDGTAPLTRYESTIRCRFCPDDLFVARWTANGPLVSDLVGGARRIAGANHGLALRWSVFDPADRPLEAGFAVPRATDWASFNDALQRFTNPQQNIVFADAEGRIGLLAPGAVPIRQGHDGTLPVLGWTADSAWAGMIPYEALPRQVDPPNGRLANANNALVDSAYPYLLSRRWDAPWRYHRIVEQLEGSDDHDVSSFLDLQADVRSGMAQALLPLMLDAAPLDADAARWRDRLASWDRHAIPDSIEQTVFQAWYGALGAHLYADELGPAFARYGHDRPLFIQTILRDDRTWCDDITTAGQESCPLVAGRALEAALDHLEASLGPEGPSWAWGRQHPLVREHDVISRLGPLARFGERRTPGAGDGTSINATSHSFEVAPPLFPSRHGAGYRHVVDLGALDQSRFAIPSGQVGHPASRHYRDIARLWDRARGVPMRPPANPRSAMFLQP